MLATIGIIIDVVLVLAIVIFGIIGLKKGLMKTLLSLFSWSFCLLVAIFSAKYVAGWLNGIFNFSGMIGTNIANSLGQSQAFFLQPLNSFADKTALMTAFEGAQANVNPVFAQLIKVIFSNNNIDFTSTQTVGQLVGSVSGQIIMVVISAILIFAVLKLATFLINKLINKITKNKVIGGLDKILGLVFGVLKGAVIIFVVNTMLSLMSIVPFINNSVTPFINDNTHVEKFVYEKTDYIVDNFIINGELMQEFISNSTK